MLTRKQVEARVRQQFEMDCATAGWQGGRWFKSYFLALEPLWCVCTKPVNSKWRVALVQWHQPAVIAYECRGHYYVIPDNTVALHDLQRSLVQLSSRWPDLCQAEQWFITERNK